MSLNRCRRARALDCSAERTTENRNCETVLSGSGQSTSKTITNVLRSCVEFSSQTCTHDKNRVQHILYVVSNANPTPHYKKPCGSRGALNALSSGFSSVYSNRSAAASLHGQLKTHSHRRLQTCERACVCMCD